MPDVPTDASVMEFARPLLVLFCLLLGCGSSDGEGATTPTTPAGGETSTESAGDVRPRYIARIRDAREIGEMYLAYAVDNDDRMSGVVRCESELPVNTGDALRPDGTSQSFESVEWLSEETTGSGPAATTRLRYRVSVRIEGEQVTRVGALTLQYEPTNRSYVVVCPQGSTP